MDGNKIVGNVTNVIVIIPVGSVIVIIPVGSVIAIIPVGNVRASYLCRTHSTVKMVKSGAAKVEGIK